MRKFEDLPEISFERATQLAEMYAEQGDMRFAIVWDYISLLTMQLNSMRRTVDKLDSENSFHRRLH